MPQLRAETIPISDLNTLACVDTPCVPKAPLRCRYFYAPCVGSTRSQSLFDESARPSFQFHR